MGTTCIACQVKLVKIETVVGMKLQRRAGDLYSVRSKA